VTEHDKYDCFEVLGEIKVLGEILLLKLMSEFVPSKPMTCSFKLGWAIVEKAM
jgi:hypothetical protein